MLGPRQATVGKRGVRRRELGVAVGRQIDRCEGLAVQGEREGQRKCGDAVVAMIANVRRARHNASASLNYGKTRARYRCWSRRSRRRRRWTGCRCRSRRRQRNVPSSLNSNKRRRAGLKIAYRRVRWVRRLIGIKPEVIQGAKANRVGILILGKRFRGPGDRARVLGNTPRRAAITLVIERAIICPAGLLNRRMKSDVRDVYSGSNRHAERLDSAIEVLIVESVFIVPDAGGRVRHFEAHEPDTIISRVRLLPVYRRTGPGHNVPAALARWLLSQ